MFNNATKERLSYLYASIFLFLITLGLFSYITIQVTKHEILQFDQSIISYVQSYVGPQLTEITKIFTHLGSVKLMAGAVVIISIILFLKNYKSLSMFVFFATFGGGAFNLILKTIIQRERPDILKVIEASGYSFPSGHSMGSIIFYGSLAFLIFKLSKNIVVQIVSILFAVILVVLIGLSRIYLGVHFPTDVVAGFSFGAAWLLICITAYRYYEFRKDGAKYLYVKKRY